MSGSDVRPMRELLKVMSRKLAATKEGKRPVRRLDRAMCGGFPKGPCCQSISVQGAGENGYMEP